MNYFIYICDNLERFCIYFTECALFTSLISFNGFLKVSIICMISFAFAKCARSLV